MLCGCIGVVAVMKGNLDIAAYLIWLAAILDFFDGFVARLLNAYSAIGKDLDSLADMVTFGFLPAFIMYSLLFQSSSNIYLPFIAFFIAIFSALRLAKFNTDTRQTHSFIGLPTPANALFISSLPLIAFNAPALSEAIISNPYVLASITIIFSLLMVAEIELFSLKFKDYHWANNRLKFLFIIISFILLISLKFLSIPIIIILYLTLSVAANIKQNH